MKAARTSPKYRIQLLIDLEVRAFDENGRSTRTLSVEPGLSAFFSDGDCDQSLISNFEAQQAFLTSADCMVALRDFLEQLLSEIDFNLFGKRLRREKYIKDSTAKFTRNLRRRVKAVRGRPPIVQRNEIELRSDRINRDEVVEVLIEENKFVAEIEAAIKELYIDYRRINKTLVAETLFPKSSNPLRDFNRKLTKYGVNYMRIYLESLHHRD